MHRKKVLYQDLGNIAYKTAWDYQESLLQANVKIKSDKINRERELNREEERNDVMANNLAQLITKYPNEKILAVIGAGHEEEMMKLIKEKLYKHSSE